MFPSTQTVLGWLHSIIDPPYLLYIMTDIFADQEKPMRDFSRHFKNIFDSVQPDSIWGPGEGAEDKECALLLQWLMFISLSSSSPAEKEEKRIGSHSRVRRLTRQAVWVLLNSGIATRRTSWPSAPREGGACNWSLNYTPCHPCNYSTPVAKTYVDRKRSHKMYTEHF